MNKIVKQGIDGKVKDVSSKISPDEYAKTEAYKEWKQQYNNRVDINDLRSNPVQYGKKVYCSSKKLKKSIERDFKNIKLLCMRNSWRFNDLVGGFHLGFRHDNRVVKEIWLGIGNKDVNAIACIYIKEKGIDLREQPDNLVLNYLISIWNDKQPVEESRQ